MSHIKLSPIDIAEVHERINSLLSTGKLDYVLAHQWKPNWITLKSGTQVNIGFPEIFLYENLLLLIEFVNKLSPEQFAVFIDNQSVLEWLNNEVELFYFVEEYDLVLRLENFIENFTKIDEDEDELIVLNKYGLAIQSQIKNLINLYEIDLSTIEGSPDEEDYYINLLNEIRKGPKQFRETS